MDVYKDTNRADTLDAKDMENAIAMMENLGEGDGRSLNPVKRSRDKVLHAIRSMDIDDDDEDPYGMLDAPLLQRMNATIEDYNGHCYTVVPCYVSDSSRIHYCGAYAKDFKTWRVIDELAPKESSLIAWDDLEAYVDRVDEEARERHAES